MLKRSFIIAGFILFFSVFTASSGFAMQELRYQSKEDVPRITVEELKAKYSSDKEIYILNIRTGAAYTNSAFRIPGDIRSMYGELKEKTMHIPKDAEIVTYCT